MYRPRKDCSLDTHFRQRHSGLENKRKRRTKENEEAKLSLQVGTSELDAAFPAKKKTPKKIVWLLRSEEISFGRHLLP
jgi:hypothetical protein